MIVLDCSAAVEMARKTSRGLGFRGLVLEGERIIASELLRAEARNALWKYVHSGMMTEEELNAALSELDGMVMDFVMKVTIAGEDIGCTLDMNMEYEGFKMVLDMTSDNLTSEGKFELSVEGAGEFALDFETKLTETDDEPAMVPTDGDIVDLEQLFSDMLGIYMTVR